MIPVRRSTNSRLAVVLLGVLVAAVSAAAATSRADIPSETLLRQLKPGGYVNDYAQILDAAQREALEARLKVLEEKTSAQFTVASSSRSKVGRSRTLPTSCSPSGASARRARIMV